MTQNLNTQQKRAILHYEGPMMVLAGPGSGKTMVLTWRILCLLNYHQAEEDEILVLTYTKAAAQEMRSRFFRLLGTDQCLVQFGTIHSVCLELLKGKNEDEAEQELLDEEEAIREIQHYLVTQEGMSRREAEEKGAEILQYYSYLRNVMEEEKLIDQEGVPSDPEGKKGLTWRTISFYEKMKRETGQMDFDDILTHMREKLRKDTEFLMKVQQKYRFFLVDEFQDVCPLQYEILKRMSQGSGNLFVVGDDDQAIYGFRGSQSAIMQQFPRDYPDCSILLLDVNYRSHEEIVRFAGDFINHNEARYPKTITSGKAKDNQKKKKRRVRMYRAQSESGEGRKIASFLKKWQDDHGDRLGENHGNPLFFHVRKKNSGSDFVPKNHPQAAILLRTSFEASNYQSFLEDYGVTFEIFGEQEGPYHHWIGEELWCVYRAIKKDPRAQMKLFQILYPREPDSFFHWESSQKMLEEGKGELLSCLKEQIKDDDRYVKLSELEYELKKMASMKPVDVLDRLLDRTSYRDHLKEKALKRKVSFFVLKKRLKFWREDLKQYDDFESWNQHRQKVMMKDSSSLSPVRFETIHSSKGLEYDLVVIPGIVQGRLPHPRNRDLEEERRLLYVAITRAKENVLLTSYRSKNPPSVFWDEMKRKKTCTNEKSML